MRGEDLAFCARHRCRRQRNWGEGCGGVGWKGGGGTTHLSITRKSSNIRRTKSPNLNVSRLVLQLSLSNPMKPGVKSRMKM